jgi:hypothetical protein
MAEEQKKNTRFCGYSFNNFNIAKCYFTLFFTVFTSGSWHFYNLASRLHGNGNLIPATVHHYQKFAEQRALNLF